MTTQQQDQALVTAASAALSARKGTARKDPGPGYWDGRPDYRTGHATSYGALASVEDEGGTAWARRRNVATDVCPSGPCGSRTEYVTWYVPKLYPHIPAGTALRRIDRWRNGAIHITLEPVRANGRVRVMTWTRGVEDVWVADYEITGPYEEHLRRDLVDGCPEWQREGREGAVRANLRSWREMVERLSAIT